MSTGLSVASHDHVHGICDAEIDNLFAQLDGEK